MAQIWSTDREALEKEGSQMAGCCHHRYLLPSSLLRSGERGGRTGSRTGLREVLRCQEPASSLCFSQGPQILPKHGLDTGLCFAKVQWARWFWEVQHTLHAHTLCVRSTCITQWGRRCSLLFSDTEKMLGVCLVRTVRHHAIECETGLGHKEEKRRKNL